MLAAVVVVADVDWKILPGKRFSSTKVVLPIDDGKSGRMS